MYKKSNLREKNLFITLTAKAHRLTVKYLYCQFDGLCRVNLPAVLLRMNNLLSTSVHLNQKEVIVNNSFGSN